LNNDKSINSNYKIKNLGTAKTISSDAYIKREAYLGSINSNYVIEAQSSGALTSDYNIKRIDNLATINSNSFITKSASKTINSNYVISVTYSKTLSSNSFIKQSYSAALTSNSYIKKLATSAILNSDYYVREVQVSSIASDYKIKTTYSKTINSNAKIERSAIKTINSNAEIVRITRAILISPVNGSTVAAEYIDFTFYLPESYIGNMHARIQISRNAAFTDVQYDEYSFRPETGIWEYYTGGTWISYLSAGVENHSKQTIQARVRYQISGQKYWRIRGVVR
jgi:hypothetical protein